MALMATRTRRLTAVSPWIPGTLLACVMALAYVLVESPSADLAAAYYRSALFSQQGLSLWDNGWYAGHHLLGYSVLAPALGSLLSPRLVGALSLVGATAVFGALAERLLGRHGAHWATPVFALTMAAQPLAGRIPFGLGAALAVSALAALARGRSAPAAALAVLASLASPVAGFFLALIGVALVAAGVGANGRGRAAAVALIFAAVLPVLVLAAAFPEGGYEPFSVPDLWLELLGAVTVAAVLGATVHEAPGAHAWRAGGALYALACVGAYAVHTPLGSNVTRLGPLIGGPLLCGALAPRHRGLAVLAAVAGLTWSLEAPIHDVALVYGDPSVHAAYYRPLLAELGARDGGVPLRIEIPMTGAHWEAARVGERVALARGWERQLDTRDAQLFYRDRLTASAYRSWLLGNAVTYVALPDARLDPAARAEARLIRAGLPYLAPVWRSAHWRLYAVLGAPPLVSAPGKLRALGSDSFVVHAPRPGSYTVVVHFTPYWKLTGGHGCVARAPAGWTRVTVRAAGDVRVGIGFSLARVLGRGPRCR